MKSTNAITLCIGCATPKDLTPTKTDRHGYNHYT